MERLAFLSGLMMDSGASVDGGGGESLLGTTKIAVLPIAKVFTMCFLGFLMASKYVNILPAAGRKLLNGVLRILLPTYLYARILWMIPVLQFKALGYACLHCLTNSLYCVLAVGFHPVVALWFIPVNVVLATISGSLIGLLVATVVRPPYPFFKFTIIHIGIGNIGNVPLVLIAALCRDKTNPFGDSDKCSQDGTAYISFGQWVGAIILYTYVFNMLAPPLEGTFEIGDANLPQKHPPKTHMPEQVPLLSHDTLPAEYGKIKDFCTFIYNKLKLKQIVQPPIIASILAMVIGCVPLLKQLIFTSDAPLFFFTDSCIILGEAMIPCILLALGGNLVDGDDIEIRLTLPWDGAGSSDFLMEYTHLVTGCWLLTGPGSSKLGFRTTSAIIFGRLVLVPPAGLGIVMLADKLGFLPPGNKMFRFVLLLQHTMPTSVLSGAVASLRGCGKESAAILFWVHIFAIISMAGWIVLYIHLLF
ncbi:PIN-LIKES 6-like protein [Drosera capensis]